MSFAIVAYIDLSKEKQSVTESGRYHRVVAFGCSHVVGCEIQPYLGGQIWDYDQHCKPWAFPQELAQKLQMPCSNWAMSGGSNDRSLRIFSREAARMPASIVIFGWTWTDRREFWWPDQGTWPTRDPDGYLQVGSQWADIELGQNQANRAYIRDIWRPCSDLTWQHHCVRALAQAHGHLLIELAFTNEPDLVCPGAEPIEGHSNWISWIEARGFARGPRGHALALAHQEMAEILHQRILAVE